MVIRIFDCQIDEDLLDGVRDFVSIVGFVGCKMAATDKVPDFVVMDIDEDRSKSVLSALARCAHSLSGGVALRVTRGTSRAGHLVPLERKIVSDCARIVEQPRVVLG